MWNWKSIQFNKLITQLGIVFDGCMHFCNKLADACMSKIHSVCNRFIFCYSLLFCFGMFSRKKPNLVFLNKVSHCSIEQVMKNTKRQKQIGTEKLSGTVISGEIYCDECTCLNQISVKNFISNFLFRKAQFLSQTLWSCICTVYEIANKSLSKSKEHLYIWIIHEMFSLWTLVSSLW